MRSAGLIGSWNSFRADVAVDRNEARVRRLCEGRGLKVHRFGKGWRILGERVDVLVADLGDLQAADLVPARGVRMVATR